MDQIEVVILVLPVVPDFQGDRLRRRPVARRAAGKAEAGAGAECAGRCADLDAGPEFLLLSDPEARAHGDDRGPAGAGVGGEREPVGLRAAFVQADAGLAELRVRARRVLQGEGEGVDELLRTAADAVELELDGFVAFGKAVGLELDRQLDVLEVGIALRCTGDLPEGSEGVVRSRDGAARRLDAPDAGRAVAVAALLHVVRQRARAIAFEPDRRRVQRARRPCGRGGQEGGDGDGQKEGEAVRQAELRAPAGARAVGSGDCTERVHGTTAAPGRSAKRGDDSPNVSPCRPGATAPRNL